MIGGAIFVGLTAQIAIPLWFTPVPLTLQTFSVLLVGAALGSKRGLLHGASTCWPGSPGCPGSPNTTAAGSSPRSATSSASSPPPGLVGFLAERRGDRTPLRAAGLMVLGNLVIYLFGVAGLLFMTPLDLPTALAQGVLPFLIFDAIKIASAAPCSRGPGNWSTPAATRDMFRSSRSSPPRSCPPAGVATSSPCPRSRRGFATKRPAVVARVDGVEYRSRLAVYGGMSYLGLRKDLLREIDSASG